jgi:hypothetical protein
MLEKRDAVVFQYYFASPAGKKQFNMKIKSVTMTLNDFNLAVGETGMQNNQLEVLKLIIQAFEEKIPILLINESSGRKYKLSENNEIIEVKT